MPPYRKYKQGEPRRRGPQAVGDVLAQLLARRGYAKEKTATAWADAWRQAAGEQVAQGSRAGELRGGVLEITVKNSILLQDLAFEKKRLLGKLAELLPTAGIKDLRFRVGAVE